MSPLITEIKPAIQQNTAMIVTEKEKGTKETCINFITPIQKY